MDLIEDFIEEELLGGKIVFDQSQGGYSFEENNGGIQIHTSTLAAYERYFKEHPAEPVLGTCRIIAGALVGKLKSRGWEGTVDYYFSYGHVIPVLNEGSRRILVDLGRRLPITVPVEVGGKSASSNAYETPYTYKARWGLDEIKLEIHGMGSREERLTLVTEISEEKARILESIRHNSLLLRSAWIDGKFTQTSTNNSDQGVKRLDVRHKILSGVKAEVVLHD